MARRIAKLADNDNVRSRAKMVDLAKFGREITDIEQRIRGYYAWMEEVEMTATNKHAKEKNWTYFDGARERNISYEEAAHFALEHVRKGISDIFIQAVDSGDVKIILQIADAVLFFKNKRGANFRAVDPERTLLLLAKSRLDLYEQKWTIREVAEYLAGGKKLETPADGFSTLRRKCRALNFPLALSRQTTRKQKLKALKK